MKLEEKHKEFVVKCFARFMTLTNIVDAFLEEFEDDLPPPDMSEAITVEYLMAEPLNDFDVEDKSEFVVGFIEEFEEEFKEEYGDEAEKRLNQEALEEYETLRQMRFTKMAKESRDYILTEHEEELRKSLFNRFRRFDIDHRQFPDKYRALFNETRDEFCANYRIPDLNVPENVVRELETLYGYQKQVIFQQKNSTEVMNHVNLAHQILKTIITCNALNPKQEVMDVTPQDAKALKQPQEALTDS